MSRQVSNIIRFNVTNVEYTEIVKTRDGVIPKYSVFVHFISGKTIEVMRDEYLDKCERFVNILRVEWDEDCCVISE